MSLAAPNARELEEALSKLPMRKRRAEDLGNEEGCDDDEDSSSVLSLSAATNTADVSLDASSSKKNSSAPKGREIRLEQNRKAARESRRRKKVMIEELQRSVIFFSRANSTLKQQNEELQRLLLQAQAQIIALESEQNVISKSKQLHSKESLKYDKDTSSSESSLAQHQASQNLAFAQLHSQQLATFAQQQAAAQALYESQGLPQALSRSLAPSQGYFPRPSSSSLSATSAARVGEHEELLSSTVQRGSLSVPWSLLLQQANGSNTGSTGSAAIGSQQFQSLQEVMGALYNASLPQVNASLFPSNPSLPQHYRRNNFIDLSQVSSSSSHDQYRS